MTVFAWVVSATLLLQAPAESPPPGWREATDTALELMLAGKQLEVVSLYEKWVAAHPTFLEARMMLGGAHEDVAREARTGGLPYALRDKHYEAAILHMRQAIEQAGSRAPFYWVRSFIDIHGVLGVNRPAEYERLVRNAVTRYPAEPFAHSYMIAMLADRNQPVDAAAAAARSAIPKTVDARLVLAGSLAATARDFGPLMRAAGLTALLNVASSFADEALKMQPKNPEALRTRTQIDQLRK